MGALANAAAKPRRSAMPAKGRRSPTGRAAALRAASALLALAMLLGLAACGGGSGNTEQATATADAAVTTAAAGTAEASADSGAGAATEAGAATAAATVATTAAAIAATETPSGPNELTICLGGGANGFDPTTCAAADPGLMINLLYEGLYRYSATGVELAGAESVDISDDGLVWTLKLRQDAVWSDGVPVTADNYVFSVRRLVNPDVGSGYALAHGGFVKNAEACFNGDLPYEELGIRAVDDYTLEITLAAPCAYFNTLLAAMTYFPLREDKASLDGTGEWVLDPNTFVSNGPMKFVELDADQYLVLEKNETYYRRDSVNLDRLTCKMAADSNTRLALFNSGDVDFITDFPSEETEALIAQGLYHSAPALRSAYLYVNLEREPFNDPRVRRAFALCIDREFLSDVLLVGTKIPATAYVGMGFPGTSPDKDFYLESPRMVYYDPDEARSLLAEAGYPNGQGFPVLELPYRSATKDNGTVFEYLQAVWKDELGVESTLIPQEGAAVNLARDEHRFHFFLENWGADYFDASDLLSLHTTGHFMNYSNYESPEYNRLVAEAKDVVDNAERLGMLHQAESLLVEQDMAIIPMYYWVNKFVFRDDVLSNVHYSAEGNPYFADIIVSR
jgi:oligopeptide transport system substrate-binding protein